MKSNEILFCAHCENTFKGIDKVEFREHLKECKERYEEKCNIDDYDWEQAYY